MNNISLESRFSDLNKQVDDLPWRWKPQQRAEQIAQIEKDALIVAGKALREQATVEEFYFCRAFHKAIDQKKSQPQEDVEGIFEAVERELQKISQQTQRITQAFCQTNNQEFFLQTNNEYQAALSTLQQLVQRIEFCKSRILSRLWRLTEERVFDQGYASFDAYRQREVVPLYRQGEMSLASIRNWQAALSVQSLQRAAQEQQQALVLPVPPAIPRAPEQVAGISPLGLALCAIAAGVLSIVSAKRVTSVVQEAWNHYLAPYADHMKHPIVSAMCGTAVVSAVWYLLVGISQKVKKKEEQQNIERGKLLHRRLHSNCSAPPPPNDPPPPYTLPGPESPYYRQYGDPSGVPSPVYPALMPSASIPGVDRYISVPLRYAPVAYDPDQPGAPFSEGNASPSS
ncbi:MAG: hypothetical protein HY861_04460 [Chlamydiia bacterium]|nr:hypothetical protein [Chlamydiia bacterium]